MRRISFALIQSLVLAVLPTVAVGQTNPCPPSVFEELVPLQDGVESVIHELVPGVFEDPEAEESSPSCPEQEGDGIGAEVPCGEEDCGGTAGYTRPACYGQSQNPHPMKHTDYKKIGGLVRTWCPTAQSVMWVRGELIQYTAYGPQVVSEPQKYGPPYEFIDAPAGYPDGQGVKVIPQVWCPRSGAFTWRIHGYHQVQYSDGAIASGLTSYPPGGKPPTKIYPSQCSF
jgi:hypothetical protein